MALREPVRNARVWN
ncbi:hypothetical protein E2C01_086227 [Portunus trituberculatus]|uniref:Uncharacterized protein n=1 Tax=Portunus trituberculatus TaxID=210409 RepID=A0A5B7JCV7_PORTR|nr:hypothetical protein [Portunus trituberculatus]